MNIGSSIPNATVTVLTSWKDIAHYMGKGVRTVQRWEQDFGLPVRRPLGSSKKAILARPSDLDAWVALRCSSRGQLTVIACVPNTAQSSPEGRKAPLSLGALSALNAEIHTSRMLRSSNRELMDEMRVALARLQQELLLMCPAN
ncbi:MAG TPA: hypothetical protein VFE06_07195 [Acidobacteriaceae bacterium]|jgi:predicted DNA-binding transcriptional regulator AlpA|nr:hypothetical protein [Acidobacteriaceae bacterium]